MTVRWTDCFQRFVKIKVALDPYVLVFAFKIATYKCTGVSVSKRKTITAEEMVILKVKLSLNTFVFISE